MTTLAITLAVIYAAICVGFYFFQHLAFLRPETLSPSFQYKYPFPFEEIDFKMEDGAIVNAIFFKVPNSRGVVYYLKGNSRSIKGWGKFAKDFLGNGYDFFMMDYRGFGKSRGRRTQANLFNDSQYIYKWLQKSYPEDKIVLYGRSWGSGIAARIASWNKPRILILDSPYLSFYHTIHRYLFFVPLKLILRYDIRTDQYLKDISCPVHIIHGTSDRLIPFAESEELQAMFPDKITLHGIHEARHNNLPEFPEFFEILYDILYVKPVTPL
jgi:alpha-beta hydrolase superfamily lysophospholipase